MKYRLLPIVGAVLASACVERGGPPPTGPSGPPPLPQSFGGTARFSESELMTRDGGTSLRTFEGTVTWQREAPPDPALPPGAVRYVITASQMRAALRWDRYYAIEGQACTLDGEIQVPITDIAGQPEFRNELVVQADGSYRGGIHTEASFQFLEVCPLGSRRSDTKNRMDLYMSGTLADGRLRGEMPPFTVTSGWTLTGSWDFR